MENNVANDEIEKAKTTSFDFGEQGKKYPLEGSNCVPMHICTHACADWWGCERAHTLGKGTE